MEFFLVAMLYTSATSPVVFDNPGLCTLRQIAHGDGTCITRVLNTREMEELRQEGAEWVGFEELRERWKNEHSMRPYTVYS